MTLRPAILPLFLFASGCTYLTNRGNDFADCWRGDVHAGILPGAWVAAGPLVHTGLGWAEGGISHRTGYRYNYRSSEGDVLESNPGNVHFAGAMEAYYLVHFTRSNSSSDEHYCYGILPPLICDEGVHRNWIRDFDFEVGFNAFVGASFGFSVGEFVDFLLGWFGIDIAGDDEPIDRRSRHYFRDRAGRPDFNRPTKE